MNHRQGLLVCVVEGDEKWLAGVLVDVRVVAAALPRAGRAWVVHSAGGTLHQVLAAPPQYHCLAQRVEPGWVSASPAC